MFTERRQAKHHTMSVPMRIRMLKVLPQVEELVESLNISFRGAFFPTTLPLEVGSLVEARLKMPEEVISGKTYEWTFTARVVHVQPLDGSAKKFGAGVSFLSYSTS